MRRSNVESEKAPTTTKWVDRVNKDDAGNEFVRCRLVARDSKPTREGPERRPIRSHAAIGGETRSERGLGTWVKLIL